MRKDDFPIFREWEKEGMPLRYLDSASTAHMPACVIEVMAEFEKTSRANVHRGIYELSERASGAYENARKTTAMFLNASVQEVVFTRNTTEAINLLAYALSKKFLRRGDHVMVSRAEHHSNFLPWQMLRDERGVVLDILDPEEDGTMSVERIENALHPKTKFAAFTHISHVLGTINPIKDIAAVLRGRNVLFLVDAAQSIAHVPIDVKDIGCDFLAFSGHKMGGPMGIGVLFGRRELLEELPPFLRGGGMIREVAEESAEWDEEPYKFEAGTPNVAGAVGLAKAIEYIESVGFEQISANDRVLAGLFFKRAAAIDGMKICGPQTVSKRGGVASFTLEGIHPHDLAEILDRDGVCVRAGHHCAMPLMRFLKVPGMTRASFWVYNTEEDVEALMEGIEKTIHLFRKRKKTTYELRNAN